MDAKARNELTVAEYQRQWRKENPGKYAEYRLNAAVHKLQSLGYTVDLKITRPEERMEATGNV